MDRMILACFFTVLATMGVAQAQDASVALPQGPNHFILLIDASGSVRDTGGYAAFLRGDVIARLYEGRIGDKIPAFDPERDALTLLHFGICPFDECPLARAYRYLANYNLTTDFVHPVFIHQKKVTARQLQARIKPTRYYRYTALSWAEPMALWMARAPEEEGDEEDAPAGRTFLLAVTDGEPNEHTPQREIRMLQQRGDPASVRETQRRVDAVGVAYMLSDGEDREGVAHHVFYPDNANPKYFLESYEVLTQDALDWKQEIAGLERPFRLKFSWTDEAGDQPRGVLRASLSSALRKRLGRDGWAWVRFAYEDTTRTAGFNPGASLALPITASGPLERASRTYAARLSIATVRRDSLLGRQAVFYTFPAQPVLTPRPTIFTIRYWTPRVFMALGLIALAGLIGYCGYYRFVATHLEIELPGKLKRIRLRRGREHHGVAFSSPRKDLPALTLHTPRWMRLFAPLYSGATVTLSADGQAEAAARWETPDGRTAHLEPITKDTDAFWDRIGTEPAQVTLRFKQGSQESVVSVSYPPGDTSSGYAGSGAAGAKEQMGK